MNNYIFNPNVSWGATQVMDFRIKESIMPKLIEVEGIRNLLIQGIGYRKSPKGRKQNNQYF